MASMLKRQCWVKLIFAAVLCTFSLLVPYHLWNSMAAEPTTVFKGSSGIPEASDMIRVNKSQPQWQERGGGGLHEASRRLKERHLTEKDHQFNEDMLNTDFVTKALPASIGRFWVDLSNAQASQSSTYSASEAALAIDGDVSTPSHTNKAYKSWWQVEFGIRRKITGVEVTFPPGAVAGHYQDAPLTISVDDDLCAVVTEIRSDGPMWFECKRPLYGQRVRIAEATRGSYYLVISEVRVQEEPTGWNEVRPEDVHTITCPVLSTFVHEKYLDGCEHTNETLLQVIIDAGLEEAKAKAHIAENFKNNPTGRQNICDMEGASNEHVSSTTINDCITFFEAGGPCHPGEIPARCEAPVTPEKSCGAPNAIEFEKFWATLKNGNQSSHLSIQELADRAHLLDTNDKNPVGSGTIVGSYSLLIDIFGTGGFIQKGNLQKILLQRLFPAGYTYGNLRL